MPKYRKKTLVEFEQWNPEAVFTATIIDWPEDVRPTSYMEVATLLGTSGCSKEPPYWSWDRMAVIDTKEGKHVVCPGDFIATGIDGEHWAVKPDIFAKTYELVEE